MFLHGPLFLNYIPHSNKKNNKMAIKKSINGDFRYEDLAVMLTSFREKKNLTYRGFQEAYGVDKANLQAIEKTGRKPTIDTLIRLCNILEVPMQFFITPQPKKNVAKSKNKSSNKKK